MIGAAKLEDLDRAAPDLVVEHIAEHHHIVGNEFLHAEARDRAVVVGALGGEDGRHAHALERRGNAK